MQVRVKVVNTSRQGLMLRWTDPGTLKPKQCSAKINNYKAAEKKAHQLEAKLESGQYVEPSRVSWEQFRQRYDREHLAELAKKTRAIASSALGRLEGEVKVQRLTDVTTSVLSMFKSRLRDQGLKHSTIASYLRHIKAALGWAKVMGMLAAVPHVEMPKRVPGAKVMRGRPVTNDEFQRMLDAVALERPNDADAWRFYLRGLWLSGLRLSESLDLSWDKNAGLSIDLTGRRPQLFISAEYQKSNKDERLPLTPDFADFLLGATPVEQRKGHVFTLLDDDGVHLLPEWVGRVVGRIGKHADVEVDPGRGVRPAKKPWAKGKLSRKQLRASGYVPPKYASAHDLRRAFGTRWASEVDAGTLQTLMRHRDIETTMKYYVARQTDDLAEKLYSTWASGGGKSVVSGPIKVYDVGNKKAPTAVTVEA